MKSANNKLIIFLAIATIFIVGNGCKKDFANPNAAPADQVFTSARGITAVAIGLQRTYAFSRAGTIYNIVTANGFLTNELIILNTGNLPEAQLNTGDKAVDGTNTILANIWANGSKIIFDADRVIEASSSLPDKAYASGLIGYASIYKALALGSLATFWEKVPDTIGINVTFSDRMDGFNKAVATIDRALATIATTPISPGFDGDIANSIIPRGTYIVNTLYALRARYSLYAGKYADAMAAANMVDLTKRSTMNFDAVSINPIFETATSTNNVFQPIDSTFGLPVGLRPSNTDKRVQFYTTINTAAAPRFRVGGFGAATTTPWPYYVPGEIFLIKAEALVRQPAPDLANAVMELDKVITKKAANDAFGIGADEPPYSGPMTATDILNEIYRQRSIELFMSGLKLEDMRRFGRPLTERKRNFVPYPFRERDNNPNTPTDPSF